MTRSRRAGLVVLGVLASFVLILAAVPLLLRGPIEARVRAAAGERIEADVAWDRLGLSLLRGFPNATLTLEGLTLEGRDAFAGDTLLHVPRLRLVLDAPSLLAGARGTGPLIVRALEIGAPDVRMITLEDGTSGWDGLLATDTVDEPDAGGGVELTLNRLRIDGARLLLDDRAAGLLLDARGLSHSLAGDLRRERVTLRTRTAVDTLFMRWGGLPFLSRTQLSAEADLDLDRQRNRIGVERGSLALNALRLDLAGAVEMGEDRLGLDLALDAPGTDIREILSLLPPVHAAGLDNFETAGTMAARANVRGAYGPDDFPALEVDVTVRDGMFRDRRLPHAARGIFAHLRIDNPGGDADRTVVRLSDLRATIGNDPIRGSLLVSTPVSDPELELRLNGRLDLAALAGTLELEGVEELRGLVAVDAEARGRASDLDARRYERLTAAGRIDIDALALRSASLPHPVAIDEARLRLSPAFAEVERFHGRAGSSDARLTGRVDNPLGFALRGDLLRVSGRLSSTLLNLDEWRSGGELDVVIVPANVEAQFDATADRIEFGDLELRNARGSLRLADGRATLRDVRMEALGGSLAIGGFYETVDPARPTFDLDVVLENVDVATAASELPTLRTFAPVAAHARGRFSTDLHLAGALGSDMSPLPDALTGGGSFQTDGIRLSDVPVLARLADAVGLQALRDPVLSDISAAFAILDGRLFVRPFEVALGPVRTTVSGSNGIDASIDYAMSLQLPAGAAGVAAEGALDRLASRLGQPPTQLVRDGTVSLAAAITGTFSEPAVALRLDAAGGSLADRARESLAGEAERRADEAGQRLAEAAEGARLQAEAEAARRVVEAQRQAAELREEARTRAEAARQSARERADALVAQASNPIARTAAQAAANRLLREGDEAADRMLLEADARADSLVARARRGEEG